MSATIETTSVDQLPRQALITRLKKRASQLQMLPAVAIEAIELSKRADCSMSQYSALVERDVKLTCDILKITNSAMYCPAVPIVSLHQAVLRLGLRECQNLILTACISSMMHRISLDQELIRDTLCKHGFDTALLAMYINHTFRFGFEGEEFTAGLIHDFGRTLLAVADCEQFTSAELLSFEETSELLLKERSIFGADHCQVGAWYALEQKLPLPIVEVIMWHHQPEMAQESRRLTSLIAVADHMANHLQMFKTAEGYEPVSNPFLPALSKFGDPQFQTQFGRLAGNLMEQAQIDAAAMASV